MQALWGWVRYIYTAAFVGAQPGFLGDDWKHKDFTLIMEIN